MQVETTGRWGPRSHKNDDWMARRRHIPYATVTAGTLLAAVGVGVLCASLTPRESVLLAGGAVLVLGVLGLVRAFGYGSIPTLTVVLAASTLAWTNVRLTEFMALSDLFFLCAAVSMLPTLGRRIRSIPHTFRPVLGGSCILIAGAFVASLLSPAIESSLSRLLKLSTAALLIPLIVALWNPTLKQIRLVTWFWTLSATVSALFGIMTGPGEISTTRINGLATHPNNLALCCVLAFGPAMFFTVRGFGLERILGASTVLVLVLATVASGSRAGVLGIATVALVMFLLMDLKAVAMYLAIGGALVYATFSFNLITLPENNALERLLPSNSTTSSVVDSNSERSERLSESFDQILKRPGLGVGLQEARAAHNVYLQLLSSTGLLGLVGFLMVAISSVKPLSLIMQRRSKLAASLHEYSLLLGGLISGYVGLLVAEIVSNALWERFVWLYPSLIAALYVRIQVMNRERGIDDG